MSEPTSILGIDPGAGAIKIYGPAGGVQLPAFLAVDQGRSPARQAGLSQRQPPLRIRTEHGAFFAGAGSHEWGRPLEEDLDHDRFAGAPALRALLLAGLTTYGLERAPLSSPLTAVVGLPLAAVSEADESTADAVRAWLLGAHHWQADGRSYRVSFESIKITSQPAGALFDYLLDEQGAFVPGRRALCDREIGVLSIGMNTVELLVARGGALEERFTAGRTAGVRRLLELLGADAEGLYALGELDAQLRGGRLDLAAALPVWEREVLSIVEKRWGQAYRRFAAVIVVGGGACLLRRGLSARFGGKAFVPDDPVLATARGLYKMALLHSRHKQRGSHEELPAGGPSEAARPAQAD
jgi:hypothetical protein